MSNNISTKKLATILGIVFIVSGLIFGVLFFMDYGLSGFNPEALEFYENNVDMQKNADLHEIDTIRIETASTDITLISVDSNELNAHFYGGYSSSNKSFKPELFIAKDGDKLLVKIEDTINGMMLSFTSNLKLDVYVPSQFAESVEVTSASGDVALGELSVKELSVKTSSGDIKTESIDAVKSLFNTSSGEIDFNGRFTDLSVISTSGDIFSDTVEAAASRFESSSGDIRFSGKFSEVNAKSTSGDIVSDSLVAETSNFGSNSGEIALSGAFANMTVKTTSGDITLSSSENPQMFQISTSSGGTRLKLTDPAGFKLSCKSSSGEVKSDFPVTVIRTDDIDEHELNGTVGDGSGSITITSSSGDIRILKQ